MRRLRLCMSVFSVIVGMMLMVSCGSEKMEEKQENVNSNQSKEAVAEFRGKTALSGNVTWKYTEESLGCKVYEWSEDVVLPIPAPKDVTGIEYDDGQFFALGIDADEWTEYVEPLVEKYDGYLRWDSLATENDACVATIFDMENNFMANIIWEEDLPFNNLRDTVEVWIYAGSREKHTSLDNEQVLGMALDKLQIDESEGFRLINISSKSNLSDGFDVYYLFVPEEYRELKEKGTYTYMYLCVVRDDKIVLLEPKAVDIGGEASLEFMQVDDEWKMYVVREELYSASQYQYLDVYTIEDDEFTKISSDVIHEVQGLENEHYICLNKNESIIEIYRLNYDRDRNTEEKKPVSKWLLGPKIGEIHGEGISKCEVPTGPDTTVENNSEGSVEEVTTEAPQENIEEFVENAKDSSSISYKMEGDTLYVCGVGYISMDDKTKWEEHIHDIERIVIEDGITVIGYSAFRSMPYLETVEIAGSVKVIESEAFVNCFQLNTVKMAEGIEVIESQAFCYCDLLSLDIPKSVKEIGRQAFAFSVNLDNYEIPKDAVLGEEVFYRTKLLDDMVAKTGLAIVDGVLYDGKLAEGDVIIPDTVTKIAKNAFYYNEKMTSVQIPVSVACIEDGAFSFCKVLETVECNSSLNEVGSSIFSNCERLEKVQTSENVKVISYGMFSGCKKIKNITIPKSVETIQSYAFSECEGLEHIDISSAKYLGIDVFSFCVNLKSVKLSGELEDTGNMLFSGCDALETIYGKAASYGEKLARNMNCQFVAE